MSIKSKVLTLQQAAALIRDGDTVAIGGHTLRRHPMALIHEIVRQGRRGLRLQGWNNGIDMDLLIGAGCVDEVETSYIGITGYGLARNYRRWAEAGRIRVLEHSETTGIDMFRAGAIGIGFFPTKSPLGSSLLQHNPHLIELSDPFSGEPYAAVKAARPDVAIIHAHTSDAAGNVQLDAQRWHDHAPDETIARAARTVIVTVEQIVSDEAVRANPLLTILPRDFVTAVVEAPYGAHPCCCDARYDYDLDQAPRWTAARLEEIMTYSIARELRDGDHGFIGLGTGGRAFINAVGIPSVAMELARRAWGYDIISQYGVLFEPDLRCTPASFADPYLLKWPAAAMVPVDICLDVFRRGKMSVSFISGVQIDRFGNLNSVVIGDHDHPTVRLTGPIAQTDHAAYAGRTIIIMPHERRTFVQRVDFVSAVGYLDGAGARERLRLPGGGPAAVITNLGVMRFHPDSKRMFLASVHPGVTIEQVLDNTGFDLDHAPAVPTTPEPSAQELALIREIDPAGLWLEARIR